MYQNNGRVPPVEEGQVIAAECVGKGTKGDGIFKVDGFVIIVPDTEIGETYNIKVTIVRPNIAFGEIAD